MNNAWEEAQEHLKKELGFMTYKIWISPMQKILENETLLMLRTPNKHFATHIQENFIQNITKIIRETSNKDISIELRSEQEKKLEFTKEEIIPLRISKDKNFQNFVVGPCNQFAHAAAQAVADSLGDPQYNPLFVYGPTGLGKTHLLYAIANHVNALNNSLDILYVTAEQFTNELISSLRYRKIQEFQQKYRMNCDLLLMDDVQFLSGKDRTQENLFHTFEALKEQGKQIVFTSDVLPRNINGLEPRLRTRFESGMLADTQPPDIETLIAILHQKAEEMKIELDYDSASFIANGVCGNIRELEGALNRLEAICRFHNTAPDLNFVKLHLGKLLVQQTKILNTNDIFTIVATTFGVSISDLKGKKRTRTLVRPRHICMWLIRKHTNKSFPDIGREFGGRDHASIQYACNKITSGLKKDPDLKHTIALIERNLNRPIGNF